jgi:transposase
VSYPVPPYPYPSRAKIVRAGQCTTRFATGQKRAILKEISAEYARVVNVFIDCFWTVLPRKKDLLKGIVNLPQTCDHFRCLKCGYAGDADQNAAGVILKRFLAGPNGAGCQPQVVG